MFRHRSFWIILLITAAVWVVSRMSEHDNYPLQVRLSWQGYDTARYAMVSADTVLPVVVNSNCFQAIARHFIVKREAYVLHVAGDTTVTVGSRLFDDMASQLGFVGLHGVSSSVEHLQLRLSERRSRAYAPQLRGVEFRFADQYGLSGQPRLEPDSVWLYGDTASLAQVEGLCTAPAVIDGVSDSGCFRLALEPVWRNYPALRASVDSVTLFLPVERFIEKTISVPVTLLCDDNQVRARLYPERVDVALWVSARRYDDLLADMVEAEVEYTSSAGKTLDVRVTRFPSFARVKSVSPSTLQYVIIK